MKTCFLTILDADIRHLEHIGRWGSAFLLRTARNSFHRFLSTGPTDFPEQLPLTVLTPQLICRYEAYLEQSGVSRNSSSAYMRALRAACSRAGGLSFGTNLFAKVYTGIDHTRKRAIDQNLLVRLASLPLRADSPLEWARRLFLFSYGTRGMSFVDMAYLCQADLRDGQLHYLRRKTGQAFQVKVTPLMRQLLESFQSRTVAPYLLPILSTTDADAAMRQYHTKLRYYNKQLHRLEAMLGEGVCLTSYVTRHSWATHALEQQVSISTISQALGHESEKTTRIYLKSINNPAIHDANDLLMRRLEKGMKQKNCTHSK